MMERAGTTDFWPLNRLVTKPVKIKKTIPQKTNSANKAARKYLKKALNWYRLDYPVKIKIFGGHRVAQV
jgi:hypothetical protein